MACPEIRVGTSGWNYGHWRGVLYPEGLPQRQWLGRYQSKFDTVELNASFYRLPQPETFTRWQEAAPPGFLWAVKAHRGITHFSRLASREPLEKFLASVEGLGRGLGVVETFLGWLPKGKRYAIEPRNKSWFGPEALELLTNRGVALCIADSGGRFPSGEHLTADFVYVRFHGGERLYASRYPPAQMRAWARKLMDWKRPAFIYFNNDVHGYAVENALELKREVAELLPRAASAVS